MESEYARDTVTHIEGDLKFCEYLDNTGTKDWHYSVQSVLSCQGVEKFAKQRDYHSLHWRKQR
jgi:hypothetical protein